VIRFKLDENLPTEAAVLLRSHGFDVLSVVDQGLGGRPDSDVAAACRSENRTLITFDLDFADTSRHPPSSYAGIIVLRLGRQDKPHVLAVIAALVPHIDETDLHGHLWIVEDTRIRIRQ